MGDESLGQRDPGENQPQCLSQTSLFPALSEALTCIISFLPTPPLPRDGHRTWNGGLRGEVVFLELTQLVSGCIRP